MLACAHVTTRSQQRKLRMRRAGFLPEAKGTALELTQRSTPRKLQIGSGFRHYTAAVGSIKDVVKRAKTLGFKAYEGQDIDDKHQFVQARCAVCSLTSDAWH